MARVGKSAISVGFFYLQNNKEKWWLSVEVLFSANQGWWIIIALGGGIMKSGGRHKWRQVILLCLQPQPLPSSKSQLAGGCSAHPCICICLWICLCICICRASIKQSSIWPQKVSGSNGMDYYGAQSEASLSFALQRNIEETGNWEQKPFVEKQNNLLCKG